MKKEILFSLLLLLTMIFVSCGGGYPNDSTIEKDIESYWKSTYPNQTITGIEMGHPWEGNTVMDGVEKIRYEVACVVEVERADGTSKTYNMSANYLGNSSGSNFSFVGMGVY